MSSDQTCCSDEKSPFMLLCFTFENGSKHHVLTPSSFTVCWRIFPQKCERWFGHLMQLGRKMCAGRFSERAWWRFFPKIFPNPRGIFRDHFQTYSFGGCATKAINLNLDFSRPQTHRERWLYFWLHHQMRYALCTLQTVRCESVKENVPNAPQNT